MNADVVILSAGRSAISRGQGGLLSHKRPDDILADLIRESLSRLPRLDWQAIDDVFVGCATPEGEQGLNVARQAALLAGLPVSVPALTISRFELSSLSALALGWSTIASGAAELVLVGGLESASRIPQGGYNPSPNPTLLERQPEAFLPLALAGEFLAPKLGFTRAEMDAYVLDSQARARSAALQGALLPEILAQSVLMAEDREVLFAADELNAAQSYEDLAALPPHFLRGGVLTLGNTAAAADGAALVLLARAERARELGLTPLAGLRGSALCALPPEQAGLAQIRAAQLLLANSGLCGASLGLAEIEEASALDALAFARELALPDPAIINPNGGALAFGHLGGACGVRLLVSLVHALAARQARFGLVAQNSVGGVGQALLVENAAFAERRP